MSLSRNAKVAAAVAKIMVPGFPEIIARGPQCRICGLAEKHPKLLRAVHKLAAEGHGAKAVVTKTKLAFTKAGLEPLHFQAVLRHRKHIALEPTLPEPEVLPPDPVTERALAPVSKAADETAMARARLRVEAEGGQPLGDYYEAWALFERLRIHLDGLDRSSALRPPSNDKDSEGASRLAYALMIWLKLVSESRKLLETVNRMKNADRFTVALLEAHTKRYSQELVARLKGELLTMLAALRSGQTSVAIAQINQLLDVGDLAIILNEAKDVSLQHSLETFRVGVH